MTTITSPANVSRPTIRPNQSANKEITFLWEPGTLLAELAYTPKDGLGFLIHKGGRTTFETKVGDYSPLQWIADFVRAGVLRLPSAVEPHVSIDSLAEAIRLFVHRYFDCDSVFESVAVLYVLHTWIYERFHAVPYLRLLGLWGSGKTRATETIGAVCNRPLMIAGSTTPAPMFRMIEAVGGTLLLDEADYSISQVGADITKVLNCGYQQGLAVTRMEKNEHEQFVPKLYQVFGPKILNGRKPFRDEATESRCLSYKPNATERHDIPIQLPPVFEAEALEIRNRALDWRFTALESFKLENLVTPGLRGRTKQIVLPLMSIANKMTTGRERYTADLLAFATLRDQQSTEVNRSSYEAKLVDVFVNFKPGTSPTCNELRNEVIRAEDDTNLERWFTAKWVGAKYREMGFETPHTNKGAVPRIDAVRLTELCGRFGIVTAPSPEAQVPTGIA
jgi:hypothetical protein